MKTVFTCVVLGLSLLACTPFVPVTDISTVPPEKLQKAYQIKTYTTGSDLSYPEVAEYMGDVTAYSCKHLLTDPPASKGNALTQLKIKALDMGANGIIDLNFDSRDTDTWGTNCWESVQASGVAVKFK